MNAACAMQAALVADRNRQRQELLEWALRYGSVNWYHRLLAHYWWGWKL